MADPHAQDGDTAGEDVAPEVDEEAGPWIVAAAEDAAGSGGSESASTGAAGDRAPPEAPSLVAAGVGLGGIGLIGAAAIGANTKAPAMPPPKPGSSGTSPMPGTSNPSAGITPIDKSVMPGTSPMPGTSTPSAGITPDEKGVVPGTHPMPGTSTPSAGITPPDPSVPPVKPVTPPEPVYFSVSNAHVIEATTGTRELVFLVRRTGDTNQNGSVRFSVQSDKNTTSTDELTGVQTGTVSFKAGESQQLVRLNVKGDYLKETDERVAIKLHDPVAGTLGRSEGDGTIHEVDVTRLQAAYGLRDLNPELEGPAIRVRRSSDSTELDIGFDAHGELDRDALLKFVGHDARDKGFVTHWYDQSGHARHMEAADPNGQGVIVHGGKIVSRSDGTPGISFNAGRNGKGDDTMLAPGLAANNWQSVVIHADVQSEGSNPGTLFNLSDTFDSRLSAHFPDGRDVHFDVKSSSGPGRLVWSPKDPDSLTNSANLLVFEAHGNNSGAGTPALGYTDAKQAIFENGVRVASDESLEERFATTTEWRLASHGDDGSGRSLFQQAMYNEFLVYLAKDNSTPSVQKLVGTAQDDVLTYSGEHDLTRIDGLQGHDTLYVSGKAVLDLAQFTGGVKNIEQIWLDNGEANTIKLTASTLGALDVKTLAIRLDAKDSLEIDEVKVPVDGTLMKRLEALNAGMQFGIVLDGQPVIG